jgi:flagellar assembly protein FliH
MSSDWTDKFSFPQFSGGVETTGPTELFESFDTEGCPPPGASDPERQMEDARLRIERIEQEAYEKAFVLGERAGREMGEAAVSPLVEKLSAALDELSKLRGRVMKESERELIALSFSIARAVIAREVSVDPDILLENVRRSLVLAGDGGKLILRVNPADASAIWREREALAPWLEGKGELRVESNETIERGGCIAVTDFAEVDATIAGQCQVLLEALEDSGEAES